MQRTVSRHDRRENQSGMSYQSDSRENAGTTSKDSTPERRTKSRTRVATREEMLVEPEKPTELRKLLNVLNAFLQNEFDLVGAKEEYDALMRNCNLKTKVEAEDRQFPRIKNPTKSRENNDYYREKYKRLVTEREQYQSYESTLYTEIEKLKMEIENKNTEIEYLKSESKKINEGHDSSRDAKTIEILMKENDKLKQKVDETEEASRELRKEYAEWLKTMSTMEKGSATELAQLKKELTDYKSREEEYKKRLKEEQKKTKSAEVAKMEALTRLSKEMGTKLNDNNPDIADLSDPNRATKLAEMYSEIYDNEWTDALEELETYGNKEETSIRMLLDIVKKVDKFCKNKAEDQIRDIEDSFFMFGTDKDSVSFNNKKTILKMLKDQRKLTAEKTAERIYKEFLNGHEPKYLTQTEYVKKVVKLCWLMAVQDPPVCFGNEAKAGDKLDIDTFKVYTQSGTYVSYTVWLPMFIHEGGPVLIKGVAQPIPTRSKSAPTTRDQKEMKFKSQTMVDKHRTKENYIPPTKRAWEPPFSCTNDSYSQPIRNYQQSNKYPFGRYTEQHKPLHVDASNIHSRDTERHLTDRNRAYMTQNYGQSTTKTYSSSTYQPWR